MLKTWPSGLRPTASVFVYLRPSGNVFNIAWPAMIKTYSTHGSALHCRLLFHCMILKKKHSLCGIFITLLLMTSQRWDTTLTKPLTVANRGWSVNECRSDYKYVSFTLLCMHYNMHFCPIQHFHRALFLSVNTPTNHITGIIFVSYFLKRMLTHRIVWQSRQC